MSTRTMTLMKMVLASALLTAGLHATATPLYEQLPISGGTLSHDEFPPGYYADAFTFDEAYSPFDRVITEIEWWGAEDVTNIQYNLRFYEGDGGEPGSLIQEYSNVTPTFTSGSGTANDLFAWDLLGAGFPGLRLGAEPTYYFSVAAVEPSGDLTETEGFNWSHSSGQPDSMGLLPWHWHGVDADGQDDWHGHDTHPANFAFRFNGHIVPEPASMTLLGIGLAGLGFRRYRKGKTA